MKRINTLKTNKSLEQSPTWEADSSSASQEIPRILRKQKLHYRTDTSPPLVLILNQISSVQAVRPTAWRPVSGLSSHLRLGLPTGLFPSGFPTKTLYAPPLSPIHNMPRPTYFFFICIIRVISIWWAVDNTKLLVTLYPPLPCYLVPLRTKYLPHHTILRHPQSMLPSKCTRPSYTLVQNKQNYSLCT